MAVLDRSVLLRRLRRAHSLETASDSELLREYRQSGDAAAFEALVRRHGDLVLRVCRRVLSNAHDAEDAFQATFLLFARKAGSVRKRESLASFLHGMANRVARNAARGEARRRQRERATARSSASPPAELGWFEVQAVLDEEVRRLPATFRSAFVQCCLEGQSRADAARQLGITEVTLSGRLHRAKTTLKTRLARRGISLSMLLAAVSLAEATPSATLLATTIKFALRFAVEDAPAGVSAAVLAIARQGLRQQLASLAGVVTVILVAGLLALTIGDVSSSTVAASNPTQATPGADEAVQFEGVVLDERQAPQPGVTVWLLMTGYDKEAIDGVPPGKTTTDGHGRFRLETPRRWRPEGYYRQLSHLGLLAYRRGACPAALAIHHDCRGLLKDIKLTLRSAAESRLTLWNTEQKPVQNAQAGIRMLLADLVVNVPPDAEPELQARHAGLKAHPALAHGRLQSTFHVPIPLELRDTFRGVSNSEGTATIKEIAATQISQWTIKPQGEPEVNASKSPYKLDTPWPEGLVLPAMGKLQGTIKAPSAEHFSRLKVQCWSSHMKTQILIRQADKLVPADGSQLIFLQSLATVPVDEKGRFTADLRAGYAGFHVVENLPEGLYVVSGQNGSTTIGDKPAELALELKPTVRVTGVIQSQEGRPLAGVAVYPRVHYDARKANLTTDEQGRFTLQCLPGEFKFGSISGDQIPPLTARDLHAYRATVPADVKEFTLPPMKVPTFIALRGEVRDEAGRPVAGATVTSRWLGQADANLLRVQFRKAKTGLEGQFTIERIDPRKTYTLTAISSVGGTEAAVGLKDAALATPVSLVLRRDAAVKATGRVVNASGAPVVGALVELQWRPPISANHFVPPPPLAAPGVGMAIAPEDLVPSVAELPVIPVELPTAVRSDQEGRYVLPAVLGMDGEYRIVVSAQGSVNATSSWVTTKRGQDVQIPTVALLENRPFAGRVVDRQGQPVAGAEVIYHDATAKTRIRTNGEGAFQFERPALPGGLLFVNAPAFRFHGQPLREAAATTITLTRHDEQPQAILRTLPPALSPADRRKLAEELFQPVLHGVLKQGEENSIFRPLQILAAFDPARSLEELDKKPFKTEWFYDSVKQSIAKQLARDHLEEARTVVDSMQKASSRCQSYLDIIAGITPGKRDLKRELLAQALLHARAETDGSRRVLYEGKIANQFIALGETEQGTRLLREAHETAKGLPTTGWGGYARGAFAQELATIDLPAAEKLCDGLEDKSAFTRHLGNIAHLMAGKQPEEAQRLLEKATNNRSDEFEYGRYAERVSYRMAKEDLNRAKEVASRVKTYHHCKAQAYAQIANALAKDNPKEAEAALKQAFAALAAGVSDAESDFTNIVDAPTVAATFLPIAEAINPNLVAECFWQALSFRPDRQQAAMKPFARNRSTAGDITLAMVLARYDRRVAEQLLEAAVPSVVHGTDGSGREFFAAAAVACPQRLREWLRQLGRQDYKDSFVEAAVELLLADGERQWRQIHRKLFLWYADEVDF
jgi:RNA polymerase sigma factor (sigma-70 family)